MMLTGAETKEHLMLEMPVSNELESMYNKVVTVYHATPYCNLP